MNILNNISNIYQHFSYYNLFYFIMYRIFLKNLIFNFQDNITMEMIELEVVNYNLNFLIINLKKALSIINLINFKHSLKMDCLDCLGCLVGNNIIIIKEFSIIIFIFSINNLLIN